MEGFYRGLVHPLIEPASLTSLLTLGLLLSCVWPGGFRTPWMLFASALVLGLLAGAWLPMAAGTNAGLYALAAIAALLVAVDGAPRSVRGLVHALCAGLGGLLIGLAALPDPGPLRARLITMGGSIVGANLVLLYLAAGIGWLRARFDRAWLTIGLRIVAAWIAAIAILMLALTVGGSSV